MNLPQDHSDAQNWRAHIVRAKTYLGSMIAFCREQNIDYDKFMYHRGRYINSQKIAAKSAGFAKIQATVAASTQSAQVSASSVTKQKSYPQLPDPKWLSELIHNLIGHQ